LDRQLEKHHKI